MSKALIFVAVLFALATLALQAKNPQRIENPHYGYRTHPTHTVRSIDKSDTATILTIEARLFENWFISVGHDAQLIDSQSGDTLTVRRAEGITLGEKFYLPQSGRTTYRLFFPPLSKGVSKVDFFPFGANGSCRTYGLRIDGSKPSTGNGVLDALQGNWFASDGSGDWAIGFLGNLVIWENDFWYTTAPDRKGMMELINRVDNSLRDTIVVQRGRDGSCTVGKFDQKGVRAVREQKVSPDGPRTADDDRSWSDKDMLTGGKALLRGVILDYNSALGWSKGQVKVGNAFFQDDRNFLIEVAADGTFQTEIELPFPSEVMITLNDRYTRLHIAPSDTVVLCVPYDELSRTINGFRMTYPQTVYMGDHARLNTQIGRYYDANPVFSHNERYRTMGYREFARWHAEFSDRCLAQIEQYITANNLSRKAADYIRLSNAIETAYAKIIYPEQREYYLSQDATITDRDLNIPASFFRFSANFPVNDPKLVTVRHAYYLANGIEYIPTVKNATAMVELSTMERLRGETLAPKIHAVADSLIEGLIEIDRSNVDYYMPYLNIFESETEKCQPFARQIILAQVGRVLSDSLGIVNGSFLGDVIKTSVVCRDIDSLLDAAQLALILGEFIHPSAMRWVIEFNENQRSTVVEPMATIEAESTKSEVEKDAPKVTQSDAEAILARVLAPYVGKVVYLDFWAMWCGPCRGGMENSYRVKDLVSGNKNIVFAYITTEKDSPKAAREKFISENKITGEFLFISRDEWQVLCTHFNISGIPHYMIIGPDGKVIDPECRFHDDEDLANELKKIAKVKN